LTVIMCLTVFHVQKEPIFVLTELLTYLPVEIEITACTVVQAVVKANS